MEFRIYVVVVNFLVSAMLHSIGVQAGLADSNVSASVTTVTMCLILEEDSYYTTYNRIAAAVDLAVTHANAFTLPSDIRLNVIYQNAGPSCTEIQYTVITNVLNLLKNGMTCNAFLGAGKETIYLGQPKMCVSF